MHRRHFISSLTATGLAAPALVTSLSPGWASQEDGVAGSIIRATKARLQFREQPVRRVFFVDDNGGYRKNLGQLPVMTEAEMDGDPNRGTRKVGYVLGSGTDLFVTSSQVPPNGRANLYIPGNSQRGMVYGEVQIPTRRPRGGIPDRRSLERQLRPIGQTRYNARDDQFTLQVQLTYRF